MRIGELATQSGITPETARFYEKRGLIPVPARSESGYRDFAASTVDRIRFIRTAQTVGFTLAEIGEILALRDRGQTPCTHVQYLIKKHSDELQERIEDLQNMRDELQALATLDLDTSPNGRAIHCQILEHSLSDPGTR